MQPSVRTKLRLIVGSSTLALLLMVAMSQTFFAAQTTNLTNIERRLVPRLELAPKLETELEHLRQKMQDAVAAEDAKTLDEALEVRNRMFDLLAASAGVLGAEQSASLRWGIQDYYQTARNVSERLIARETGAAIVDDMQRMQESYQRTLDLIGHTARVKPNELSLAFDQIRDLMFRANAYRVMLSVLGLAGVAFLSVWASRSLLRGLSNLSQGLARFSTGDFTEPVAVEKDDELGRVATDANRMAESLRMLAERRDREDWIKSQQTGLAQVLWGELHVSALAERALGFLLAALDARAGALYLAGDDGVLRLEKQLGLTLEAGTETGFREGEGLLGRAALADDLVVVSDVPEDFLPLRSGLGAGMPRELLLLPLSQAGRLVGVLELAFFTPSADQVRELLRLVRRILVIAIEAARSRERMQALLEESQTLAETLSIQEEELKRNNEELTAQQEDLRVANDELAAQREELHRRNLELESTRERVQQKADELAKVSAYKSQFLANMSHELRTPLNSMLLLSQLLSENEGGNLTDKQVEHMKTIHAAGEDLLGLINEILDLARIEAGRQEVHFEQVELSLLVAFARRVFEPMAAQKGLALHTELEPGLPQAITTDAQRVERILTNLIGNAIKFTDAGEVRLSVRKAPADLLVPAATGSVLAFAVSDTGVGIPLEAQERVFSPFEQLEAHANRRYEGSGLGLAIARESAQLLGGDLRVESVPGKGSTFTCYLPLKPPGLAQIAARTALSQRPTEDDRATLSPNELYLLVIEDDPVLAEQLVSIIHTRGLKALVTSSGVEGLKLARERKPVGIVLDVRLPDLDGWTVMEQLRADPVTRSIPVHFVSGVDSRERGMGLGAVGYLTKPVTHSELAGAVRALMVAPGADAGKILVVEDDPDQRESLVELLESQEFEVRHADSARAAIAAVRADTFGCMILDLGLPDIDGLGLLREMRDDAEIHTPRVLVHTGRMLSKAEARELEAYAEAVILKDERSLDRLLDEVRLFVHHVNSAPLPAKRTSERPRPPDVPLRGMKILLAEDDMRTVYALSAVLRGRGAAVLVADTGREALETLTLHPDVDCVLMDIMMPEMDGYEAMRRLRKDPRFARLPVIALTARAMKAERERCLEAGASDYLAKPVDGEQLVSAVSSWFRVRDASVSGAPG